MSVRLLLLDRFLLRHYVVWVGVPWGGLIALSFFIGVIERALSRLHEEESSRIFLRVVVQRVLDMPIYIEQTMPYGVLLGLMLGPWVLWRRGEWTALRFLGAGGRLLGVLVVVAFGFGMLESLVVVPSSLEVQSDKGSLWREPIRVVRKLAGGERLLLSAESYNLQNGEIVGEVQAVVVDANFRVERYITGTNGRVTDRGWQIFSPRIRASDGRVIAVEGEGKSEDESTAFLAVAGDLARLRADLRYDPQQLTLYNLPQALRSAAEQGRPKAKLLERALFLLTLPLFYMGFAALAYATARCLPLRGKAPLVALAILLLPFSAQVIRHLAWTQSAADVTSPLLAAVGLPSALCFAGLLVIRVQRTRS